MTEEVKVTQSTETVEQATETAAEQAAPETEFDRDRAMALIEKLRKENRELTKRAKTADELEAEKRKREEAELSELDKARKRLAELEAQVKNQTLAQMRREVAASVGLPPALADRIHGETPEEMEADAKSMLEALPKPVANKPSPGIVTNPGAATQPAEPRDQRLRRILTGKE